MTYAALTQVESSASTFSEPYIPTGTDEVEWKRWMENNGRSTEDLDDNTDDLADLGFSVP